LCQSSPDACKIEHIIRKKKNYRDETGDRNRLLNVGRNIGGTHFIVINADECFSSNLLQDGLLRRHLLNLEPGDILEMKEVCEYPNDIDCNSNFKAIAFRDNWSCYYASDSAQTSRIPRGIAGRTIRIDEPQAGLMRVKFTQNETEAASQVDAIRVQLDNIFSFHQPKAFNDITAKIFSNPAAKSLFASEIQLLGNQKSIADFIPRRGISAETAQRLSSESCRIGYLGASVSAQHESYVKPLHQFIQQATGQEHQQILCAYGAMGCLAALQKVGAELFAFQPAICFIELLTGDLNVGLTPIEEIGPALEALIRLAREAQCEPIFLNLFRADHLFNSSNPWLSSYESVATHYGIPSINVCSSIFKGLCAGELDLETIIKDSVHTTPKGSQLVASVAGAHFSSLMQHSQPRHQDTIPLKYSPRYLETETLYPNGDPHYFFKSQPVWRIQSPGGELSIAGQGYFAGLQIIVGPNSGIVEVEISSIGYRQQFSTWDHWCYHGDRFHFLSIGQEIPAKTTITLRSVRHNRTWCGFCHHISEDGTIQPRSVMPGWDSFLPRENPCSEHDVPAPQEPTIQVVSAFFGLSKNRSMTDPEKAVQSDSVIIPSNGMQKPCDVKNRTLKIVGLVPARNEKHIISQCLRALSLFTDAIVYLDDASTDETLHIVESLANECHIERIIRKTEWHRDEPGDRNAMLKAGREIGGTHFIVIDADEMLTSNLAIGNMIKAEILKLQPGDRLALNWIQLWRSVDQYRFDQSVWTWNYKEIIFCDDGVCSYSSDFIHTPRVPESLHGQTYRLEGYDAGLLHFQFVNWSNLLLKQAWYRCLERIREPGKPVSEINKRYAPSKDETDLGLKPVPVNWFDSYSFFDPAAYDQLDVWRKDQVLGWFRQYGREHFAGLDIWDVKWEEGDKPAPQRNNLGYWKELQNQGYFENQNLALFNSYGENEYKRSFGCDDPLTLRNTSEKDRELIDSFISLNVSMTAVVIGCGYGRETLAIAPQVKNVYGIDVNHTILDKAQLFLASNNIFNFTPVLAENWKRLIPSGIDFVYSITVFQHLTRDLVRDYLAGLAEKLSPVGKGLCQFAELFGGTKDAELKVYEPSVNWSVAEIEALVKEVGLAIIRIQTIELPGVGLWHWVFFQKS
ncbi:MAG: glycosyltransferase, partial [Geobacteraceae bacterium]|nr:glycosyltransferase [Geobacteraceae bacterium]